MNHSPSGKSVQPKTVRVKPQVSNCGKPRRTRKSVRACGRPREGFGAAPATDNDRIESVSIMPVKGRLLPRRDVRLVDPNAIVGEKNEGEAARRPQAPRSSRPRIPGFRPLISCLRPEARRWYPPAWTKASSSCSRAPRTAFVQSQMIVPTARRYFSGVSIGSFPSKSDLSRRARMRSSPRREA